MPGVDLHAEVTVKRAPPHTQDKDAAFTLAVGTQLLEAVIKTFLTGQAITAPSGLSTHRIQVVMLLTMVLESGVGRSWGSFVSTLVMKRKTHNGTRLGSHC